MLYILRSYARAAREYFKILEDTLLGFRVQPWRKSVNHRLFETEKFYLFDIGVSNYLANRTPGFGTPEYGKSFEHFILMELRAYQAYRNPELALSFWRTHSGLEVDLILGDMEVAIEIKTSKRIYTSDLKGLNALREEHTVKKCIIISFETEPKTLDDVACWPWHFFLKFVSLQNAIPIN